MSVRKGYSISPCWAPLDSQLASLSGPIVLGGLGKLRMTSLASCDLLTMASFSRTAVCIRRTLDESFLLLAAGTVNELPAAAASVEEVGAAPLASSEPP